MENATKSMEQEFKAMMDEENLKKALEVPAQAMNIVIETTKKVQEANLEYFRQVERIQREHWQGMSKLISSALPGESKLWDAQIKMVESGFDMFDRMMAAGKQA